MSEVTKIRILVAEDDKFLMKVYKTKLEKEGFDVVCAGDGEEVLSLLKDATVALILLDLMMPKKSGFDVLVELKADPRLKDIPVIITSNLGQADDTKKGMALGAVDYLIKSNFSIHDVVAKLKQHLPPSA